MPGKAGQRVPTDAGERQSKGAGKEAPRGRLRRLGLGTGHAVATVAAGAAQQEEVGPESEICPEQRQARVGRYINQTRGPTHTTRIERGGRIASVASGGDNGACTRARERSRPQARCRGQTYLLSVARADVASSPRHSRGTRCRSATATRSGTSALVSRPPSIRTGRPGDADHAVQQTCLGEGRLQASERPKARSGRHAPRQRPCSARITCRGYLGRMPACYATGQEGGRKGVALHPRYVAIARCLGRRRR